LKSIRQSKIERLLQKELSEIFRSQKNLFLNNKIITVTNVKSPDKNLAKVYLSIYPSKNISEDVDMISQQKKKIRFLLGKRIKSQLRQIPDLSFFVDDSIDYLENIEKLLN